MKNLAACLIGAVTFLFVVPGMIYFVSVFVVWPINNERIRICSVFLILFGIIFMIWSNIYIIKFGRGCPVDGFGVALGDRTKKLITAGPYRYSRNPMLLGTVVFYTGLSLIFNSYSAVLCCIVFAAGMAWLVKTFEEPRLYQDFGEEYLEYKKQTPLFLPKLK